MTDLIDLIEAAIDSVHDMDVTHRDYAKAVAEALPSMVKPLMWMEGGSDAFMHDADFVDTTQTYQIQEGLFWYAAEAQGIHCGTNAKAKAAAQAHHVAQIMAAFGIDTAAMKEGKDA